MERAWVTSGTSLSRPGGTCRTPPSPQPAERGVWRAEEGDPSDPLGRRTDSPENRRAVFLYGDEQLDAQPLAPGGNQSGAVCREGRPCGARDLAGPAGPCQTFTDPIFKHFPPNAAVVVHSGRHDTEMADRVACQPRTRMPPSAGAEVQGHGAPGEGPVLLLRPRCAPQVASQSHAEEPWSPHGRATWVDTP